MHTPPVTITVESFTTPTTQHALAVLCDTEALEHAPTPEGFQVLAEDLACARACARADRQAFGAHGSYAVATMYHAQYLDQAGDHMAELGHWLEEHARASANATLKPYQLHTYLREMVLALHYARHWAMLSAAYHHSRSAADGFEHITRAIRRIEELSEEAGREFLEQAAA